MSLELHVTWDTRTAELSNHLRAWSCCRDGCVCPGWGKAFALTLYLPAPRGRGRMPTTQPGLQTSSISGSSRLLGQQPGQILNKEASREAGWVINGEQELRCQAQQAILG